MVVIARRKTDIDSVAEEISQRGVRGLAISGDVMDWESIPAALDQVVEELVIDIMVNNAGGT